MSKTPCPEGQTRNAKTQKCRDKMSTGRKVGSYKNNSVNWKNLDKLKASINARTEAAIAKISEKVKNEDKKEKAKGKPGRPRNPVKTVEEIAANLNARTRIALKKIQEKNKTRKSPKAIIANLNAQIASVKKKFEGKTRPRTA